MPTAQISSVVQHLRKAVVLHKFAGLPDGQLLGHFVDRRDEAAFAALVNRHGPMVWGVCRRLLRNHQDAENAFQATFLVLVRKARSVVPRGMVANWLYGVAHRTALNARAAAAKRGSRERQVTRMPEPAIESERRNELLWVLDQELSRLPDKYRAVIVLCELEGKTRKEASRQLGCPEGTVASRLAAARALLAKRLRRHGVAGAGGALAALLSSEASAVVSAVVVSSTIKMSGGFAAGQALGSAKVVALAEEVIKAMLMKKIKTVMTVALFAGLLAGMPVWRPCAAVALARTENGREARPDTSKTLADADEVRTALADFEAARAAVIQAKQRLDEARDRFLAAKNRYETARDRGKPKEPRRENGILRRVDPRARTVDAEMWIEKKTPEAALWGDFLGWAHIAYETLRLTGDATILQDNVKTELADLVKGSLVDLTFDSDGKRVARIAAHGGTVRGRLLSANGDRQTVTVMTEGTNERSIYHLVRETEVVAGDGKPCRVRDLQAGGMLLLKLSVEDRNTVIRVEPAPSDENKEK